MHKHPCTITVEVAEAKRLFLIKDYYFQTHCHTKNPSHLFIKFNDDTTHITKTKLRQHIEQTYCTPTVLIDDQTTLRIDLEARL